MWAKNGIFRGPFLQVGLWTKQSCRHDHFYRHTEIEWPQWKTFMNYLNRTFMLNPRPRLASTLKACSQWKHIVVSVKFIWLRKDNVFIHFLTKQKSQNWHVWAKNGIFWGTILQGEKHHLCLGIWTKRSCWHDRCYRHTEIERP